MKIYIDFDGVILDTDSTLEKEYSKVNNIDKKEFVKNYDWNLLLNNSDVIADSLENLKKSKYDISLLSKISSMQEGAAKVKYLRKNNVNINIHLVPAELSKNEVVNAKDNILIDDKVYNLEKWEQSGGIPIFFNMHNQDIDIYNKKNTKYKKINNLQILLTDKLKKILDKQ